MLNINISMGNSKMGAIPNISLPPVVSSRKCNLPCAGDLLHYFANQWESPIVYFIEHGTPKSQRPKRENRKRVSDIWNWQ